jgi:glutathione S-transferase
LTYDLAIGDRAYSSWSLRGWLLFDAFNLPVRVQRARLYTDDLPRLLEGFFPARTVPVMRTAEGTVVAESLAIAEELASRHPEAGLWPKDPAARAVARMLAAEMHAGFTALRSHCPMNLRISYTGCDPTDAVLADLARLETIWSWARRKTGAQGPWLCGAYSAADAFFAPVAGRIAGYNLPSVPRPPPVLLPIWRIRRSGAGAPWALPTGRTKRSTGATIRAGPGQALPRWPRGRWTAARR